jgi:hypothetical protein
MSEKRRGRPASAERQRFWREHVLAQRTSGMTVRAYCDSQQLSRDAFVYRRKKLAIEKSAASGSEFALVPVSFAATQQADPCPGPGAPLRLLIGERFHVEIRDDFSAPVLTKLVLTLERMR